MTVRDVALWTPSVRHETRADGTVLVWQDTPLEPHPTTMTDRLLDWAQHAPDRKWMLERGPDGAWQGHSYGEAAGLIAAIGAALLAEGLSEDRPLLILSGNSVAHALMALGAQHVGVPSAALAPAYATSGGDYGKLRDVVAQLTPGMVFAESAAPFAAAIEAVIAPDVPVVTREGAVPGRRMLGFDALCQTAAGPEVAQAHAAITRDSVAKFLFTSGTTGTPKAVIQTHGMLTSNQQIIRQCFVFMQDTPPVVIDWAPWNHTASGNKVFNMVLYNGGTYYIDDGRPTPRDIDRTIRNLREVSPTWYFNVPLGYQMLMDAMESDTALRETFFRDLQMLFYAGAGMSQPVWDRLTQVAEEMVPGGVLLCTGFGATETGPFSLMCTTRQAKAGNLGIPAHGVTLKLVPQGDKLEARVKSPSVTPGYWRNPALSAEAFDDEGFYSFGDALRLADPDDPAKGVYFDGRLAENFKLASGTWVAVGALRARLTDDLRGLASDTVIAGEGELDLGALVLPDWDALAALVGDRGMDRAALLAHPKVRTATAEALKGHIARSTGSSTRVMRVLFLETPLDFHKGEVTDKGSINQRAVLRHRADQVARLRGDDPAVITATTEDA